MAYVAVEPIHIHPCSCQPSSVPGQCHVGAEPRLRTMQVLQPSPWHSMVRRAGCACCSACCILCSIRVTTQEMQEEFFHVQNEPWRKIIYKTAWLLLTYTNSCKTDLQQYHLKYEITEINRSVMSPATAELETPKLTCVPAETSPPGLQTPSSWVWPFQTFVNCKDENNS